MREITKRETGVSRASKLKPLGKPKKLRPVERRERCLVVALDVSGSMEEPMENGQPKLHVAWEAFKSELAPRLSGWELGILIFGTIEGDGTQWKLPPTSKVELDMVTEPRPQGSTPLLPALKSAWDWLRRHAEERRIIIISDGMPNQGGGPEDVLRWAREHDRVPIDTVGVGTGSMLGFDPRFLWQLAGITGGAYRGVRDAGELAETVKALSPANRPMLDNSSMKGGDKRS